MSSKTKGKSVEDALQAIPRSERVIVERLRSLVRECLPKAEEHGYYGMGVPFYRHNRLICFIWPPSINWGPKDNRGHLEKGVSLGFNQGNLMSNDEGVLLAEGRKQVYCMYFKTPSDIDEPLIRSLLYEAEMIDDSFRKKSRSKVTRSATK
jgi:hypothetical protein